MKPWEYKRKPVPSFSPNYDGVTDTERAPLSNKGSDGKLYDNCTYRTAFETISGGPQVVEDGDNLANYQRAGSLHLPPILLHNLMAWVAKFHELRISHPNGTTINATPEHVRDAVKLHPWGVVCDPERCLLLSWGDVPTVTLLGLRDLETGELPIPVQVAA